MSVMLCMDQSYIFGIAMQERAAAPVPTKIDSVLPRCREQCLKIKKISCVQLLHLRNTSQKYQKKPRLSTSTPGEEGSHGMYGILWSRWVSYLSSMLSRISKEAGTSVVSTDHCIWSTTIQKLAEGGLEAREIMAVSRHRPESLISGQSTTVEQPTVRWPVKKRPLEEVSPTAKSPAKRQRSDMMDSVFSSCNFHGSVQINFYNGQGTQAWKCKQKKNL